ncbi:MAG: sugar phosphate isomerase/epimerase [Fretibacterium sp.]|nr:sugar phosphate isomerase/epimerase [Fretibacterium sp.]
MGSTSWIVPGTLAQNLLRAALDVDDMELVLFDTPEASNIPEPSEILELRDISRDLGVTCSVHFPCELRPDVPESVERCLRVIERMAPLEPSGWVLHLVGEQRGDPPSRDMGAWLDWIEAAAGRVARALPISRDLSVETLDYDFEWLDEAVEALDLSVCLDVGHLVRYGFPLSRTLDRLLPRTRILHLHGVKPDGTDHADLSHFEPRALMDLFERLEKGPERIVTLEVFEEDFERSLEVLRGLGRPPGAGAGLDLRSERDT